VRGALATEGGVFAACVAGLATPARTAGGRVATTAKAVLGTVAVALGAVTAE
jgi:hypothetical protein